MAGAQGEPVVLVETRGAVQWIQINRPERRNAAGHFQGESSWNGTSPVSAGPPARPRSGKLGLRAVQDMTVPQAFEYTQRMLPNMAKTQGAKEGFAAFREKRSPLWTGE